MMKREIYKVTETSIGNIGKNFLVKHKTKDVYEPVYVDSYQRQQLQRKPQMSQVTLTGYSKKGNRWQSTPIRVGVTDEKVILLSVKSGYNWANCGNAASMVGGFDAEEIRDNFTYKAFNSLYGTIYF